MTALLIILVWGIGSFIALVFMRFFEIDTGDEVVNKFVCIFWFLTIPIYLVGIIFKHSWQRVSNFADYIVSKLKSENDEDNHGDGVI